MTLAETPRQILAGVAAAATFLGLYGPLGLAAWVGLAAGVAVYGATLLLVGRRLALPPPQGADFADALDRLDRAAARLAAAAARAPAADRPTLVRMADLVRAIATHHRADPRDFQHTRGFIRTALDRMVVSVEGYVDLAARARGPQAARLGPLRASMADFVTVLERIEQACLDNDFTALEVEVDVLADQLARRA